MPHSFSLTDKKKTLCWAEFQVKKEVLNTGLCKECKLEL